jgi:hypothetical protein
MCCIAFSNQKSFFFLFFAKRDNFCGHLGAGLRLLDHWFGNQAKVDLVSR